MYNKCSIGKVPKLFVIVTSSGNYRSFCGIVPIGTVTIKYRFQNTRYIGTIGTFFLVTIVLRFVLFHPERSSIQVCTRSWNIMDNGYLWTNMLRRFVHPLYNTYYFTVFGNYHRFNNYIMQLQLNKYMIHKKQCLIYYYKI